MKGFCAWLAAQGAPDLTAVQPVRVAAYVEALGRTHTRPSVGLHLAALKRFFAFLVTGGVQMGDDLQRRASLAENAGVLPVAKRRKSRIMVETDNRMTFNEPFGPAARVIVAAAGLLTFLAPWQLLISSGVDPFRLIMLPFWVIPLGALSVGLPLIAAAVFGFERVVVLDFAARTLTEEARGAFRLGWTWQRAFAQISANAYPVSSC